MNLNQNSIDSIFRARADLFSRFGTRVSLRSCHTTRMGGQLFHIIDREDREFFVKIAQDVERSEVVREYQIITILSTVVPTASVVFFEDNGFEAVLATTAVPGRPLHTVESMFSRYKILEILARQLQELWSIPQDLVAQMPFGTELEITEIRRLLMEGRIELDGVRQFLNCDPLMHLDSLAVELSSSSRDLALSHGDFCLPNILVTETGTTVLIDWGKGGLAPKARDMASLRVSLDRNLDKEAFQELASAVGFDVEENDYLLRAFRSLDFFWYNIR